jgi:hypothetical protein
MKHSHMLWFCGALMVVVAVVLVVAGAGSWAFLAPLGCVAMMGMMVWMMVRMGRGSHGAAPLGQASSDLKLLTTTGPDLARAFRSSASHQNSSPARTTLALPSRSAIVIKRSAGSSDF